MVCGRGEIINPTIIKLWGNTCCIRQQFRVFTIISLSWFFPTGQIVFVAPRVVLFLIWPLMNTRWKWYINPIPRTSTITFPTIVSDIFTRLSPCVPGLSNVNQTSSIWEHVWVKIIQTNMKHQSNPHPSSLVQVRISANRRDDDDWCRR